MATSNGESDAPHAPLELSETLYIQTDDGRSLAFEVVGILEDPDVSASYAVLRHETAGEDDEFVVTDSAGALLEDDALAQEILDDFLAFAEEDGDRAGDNGETN